MLPQTSPGTGRPNAKVPRGDAKLLGGLGCAHAMDVGEYERFAECQGQLFECSLERLGPVVGEDLVVGGHAGVGRNGAESTMRPTASPVLSPVLVHELHRNASQPSAEGAASIEARQLDQRDGEGLLGDLLRHRDIASGVRDEPQDGMEVVAVQGGPRPTITVECLRDQDLD